MFPCGYRKTPVVSRSSFKQPSLQARCPTPSWGDQDYEVRHMAGMGQHHAKWFEHMGTTLGSWTVVSIAFKSLSSVLLFKCSSTKNIYHPTIQRSNHPTIREDIIFHSRLRLLDHPNIVMLYETFEVQLHPGVRLNSSLLLVVQKSGIHLLIW